MSAAMISAAWYRRYRTGRPIAEVVDIPIDPTRLVPQHGREVEDRIREIQERASRLHPEPPWLFLRSVETHEPRRSIQWRRLDDRVMGAEGCASKQRNRSMRSHAGLSGSSRRSEEHTSELQS